MRAKLIGVHPIGEHEVEVVVTNIFGMESKRVIPLSEAEFAKRYTKWQQGDLIQVAFAGLSADDREHILTGL